MADNQILRDMQKRIEHVGAAIESQPGEISKIIADLDDFSSFGIRDEYATPALNHAFKIGRSSLMLITMGDVESAMSLNRTMLELTAGAIWFSTDVSAARGWIWANQSIPTQKIRDEGCGVFSSRFRSLSRALRDPSVMGREIPAVDADVMRGYLMEVAEQIATDYNRAFAATSDYIHGNSATLKSSDDEDRLDAWKRDFHVWREVWHAWESLFCYGLLLEWIWNLEDEEYLTALELIESSLSAGPALSMLRGRDSVN